MSSQPFSRKYDNKNYYCKFSGYVDDLKQLLFTLPLESLKEVNDRYKEKTPAPLNTQFEDRVTKEEAIKRHNSRKQMENILYPQGRKNSILTQK